MADKKKKSRKGVGGAEPIVTKWVTDEGLKRIESWARDGLTNAQICHNIGIAEGTLYRWQNEHPELKKAIKDGKRPVDFEVENQLLKSAMGFEYEETRSYMEEQPDGSYKRKVDTHTRRALPNVTAQIFWLKNRKAAQWADKQVVEHSGEISILDNLLEQMTDGGEDDEQDE